MAGLVEMFGRVLSLRRVATSDVAAGEAHAQVNPATTGTQAFLASGGGLRDRADLLQMGAAGGHAHTFACERVMGAEFFMAFAGCIYRLSRMAPLLT